MTRADTITVLRARRGKRLAKVISAVSVIDFDAAYTFDLFERPVADLASLHRFLVVLMDRPDCGVVRGVPVDSRRVTNVRRLAYRDPETGDEPTIREAAHCWLALDMEGIARPADMPPGELAACGALAIQRLPTAFHTARCLIGASASHGLKPGVRLRLWFWLDRPTTGLELKRWLHTAPADPAVFLPAQIIYTAAPIFADGARDHLPTRLIARPGIDLVVVPPPDALAPPPRPPCTSLPAPTAGGAGAYAFAALRGATVRVAQAGVGSRHATLIAAARSLARFVAAGLLTEQDVRGALEGAILQAGKQPDEANRAWAWAVAHPSTARLPVVAQ